MLISRKQDKQQALKIQKPQDDSAGRFLNAIIEKIVKTISVITS